MIRRQIATIFLQCAAPFAVDDGDVSAARAPRSLGRRALRARRLHTFVSRRLGSQAFRRSSACPNEFDELPCCETGVDAGNVERRPTAEGRLHEEQFTVAAPNLRLPFALGLLEHIREPLTRLRCHPTGTDRRDRDAVASALGVGGRRVDTGG
jgi:hypothetical protein